jgi:hypothetical protein
MNVIRKRYFNEKTRSEGSVPSFFIEKRLHNKPHCAASKDIITSSFPYAGEHFLRMPQLDYPLINLVPLRNEGALLDHG